MSVIRQFNWLGQQRVDVPHLRMLESAAADDWDVYVGAMVAGGSPYVLKGFALQTAAAGTPASSLQLSVASGLLVHPLATATGTLFAPAAGRTVETLSVTNARVSGSFTAGATNYVGLDLVRSADDTTADLVEFLDVDTAAESPAEVPLGLTLDYVIVISTQPFSTTPTLVPLAKVTTDANNNVVSNGIVDARGILWRLGTGGDLPNATATYAWPGGRTETGANTDFGAGDKAIDSQKAWMNAIMTRLWELGGGEHWYSPTADHNVHLVYNGTTFFSNGEYYEWTGTNLHWRELRFVFDNSTGYYNDVADQTVDSAGLTDLADGECVYVDLDRTSNRTGGTALVAQKAVVATLGAPLVPGSRYVFAWRIGSSIFARDRAYAVGATFNPATTTAIGMVKLSATPGAPSAPVVFNPDANGMLTVAATAGNAAGITTTGNGTGAGIAATGGATGPGASFTPGGSGASAVTLHNISGNTAPLSIPYDSGGKLRSYVDWLGMPGGRLGELHENWLGIPASLVTSAGPLSNSFGPNFTWEGMDTGANATQTAQADPLGLMNGPGWINSNSGTSANSYQNVYSRKLFNYNADSYLVAEFENIFTLAASRFFIGLSTVKSTAMPTGTDVCIGVGARTGDTNYQLIIGDGVSVVYNDTGIPVSNGQVALFRLEVIGANLPGASARVNLTVNYTLTASRTLGLATNTNMLWEMLEVQLNNAHLHMGGLNMVWGRVPPSTLPY